MDEFLELLKQNNLLKIISQPLDTELEMAHLAYIEAKKANSKALLFTNPINKNKKFKYPVLMNTFCSELALNLALSRDYKEVARDISKLSKLHIPKSLGEKIDFFSKLLALKNIPPKRLSKDLLRDFDKVESLYELPILKTWEEDAAPFITMGQVYTQSLDGKENNLGMYRLQLVGKEQLLMHWQIHKDAAHFFHEYKKAGVKMPVSIAIGGDPLYIWCSQAPLPKGIFELLLYGFIKKKSAKLIRCKNGIYVPKDSDFIIEGFVDCEKYALEGPFGDHTGFYTRAELFPVFKSEAIYARKNAIFQATVVGKPPLEDKYMALGTERIFLPLLKTNIPALIDYKMPENGVFHNLILAKFDALYPAHAMQLMHAFWGIGQMSFVKHAIFVSKDAPLLDDYKVLCKHILDRFNTDKILISEGICDELDHASPNACFGGKLGLDASGDIVQRDIKILSDEALKEKFGGKISSLKQFFKEANSPVVIALIDKKERVFKDLQEYLKNKEYFKILIFLDINNNLENPYMLIWKIVNNIDAKRDIIIKENRVFIDASAKSIVDGYEKEWPKQTNCSKDIINKLIDKGLLEKDEEFFNKFELF